MKINCFDIEKRWYQFEVEQLQTTWHAHPVYEYLICHNGNLSIETPITQHTAVAVALIAPNQKHQVHLDGQASITLLEANSRQLSSLLLTYNITFLEGVWVSSTLENSKEMETALFDFQNQHTTLALDARMQACLDYLQQPDLDYSSIFQQFKDLTHLSDSRLSHLFKQEMGISIKKYLLWHKLKQAFHQVVHESSSMYEAAFANGFYDATHLSKAFQQVLGLRPSSMYNSSTLPI